MAGFQFPVFSVPRSQKGNSRRRGGSTLYEKQALQGVLRLVLLRTENWLVRLLGPGNSFVDGLAAGETFVRAVPVRDGVFAHLPAEQDDSALDLAGEIEQADVDVFHLDADGIDFGKCVFGALFGLGALGLAARDGNHVDVSATVEEDAMIESLHLALYVFHHLLAADGGTQQGFEYGKQRLGFVEGEGAFRHDGNTILTQSGERPLAINCLPA